MVESSELMSEQRTLAMRQAMERVYPMMAIVMACGLGLTGCLPMHETRLPSCIPRSASVESRSYEFHDPFADESIGPATFSRPRAFQEPRSDTRKSSDLRFLQAAREFAPRPQAFWDPLSPTGTAGAPIEPLWRTRASSSPIAIAPRSWNGNPYYNVVGQ